jgi:hypothetical protein
MNEIREKCLIRPLFIDLQASLSYSAEMARSSISTAALFLVFAGPQQGAGLLETASSREHSTLVAPHRECNTNSMAQTRGNR